MLRTAVAGLPISERGYLWLWRAVVAICFLCFFPYLAAVNNPNENVRTYQTMALVEQMTFRLDEIVERHGWVNDMAKVPDPKSGKYYYYSVKAPAITYMGVPVYWAWRKVAPLLKIQQPTVHDPVEARAQWLRSSTWVLRLFTVQIPGLLFLWWLERFFSKLGADPILTMASATAAGLGTNYLAYSLMFASHAPFAIAAFLSFAIIWQEQKNLPLRSRRLNTAFAASFFAAWATDLEYHALPVTALLFLYGLVVFRRPKHWLVMALGSAIHVAAMMWFQWRSFHNPFVPGHKMCETPAFAAVLNQGLFGIVGPSKQVFLDISTNTTFGFFGTSLFMYLGLAAACYFLVRGAFSRHYRTMALTHGIWFGIMLALWLTVSSASNWRGGWTIGPRYLGAAPPFFAFGALIFLNHLGSYGKPQRLLVRSLAVGLSLASVISIGLPGLLFNSLPEELLRPLGQFAVPLLRTGFVSHTVAEWFGIHSARPFYIFVIVVAVGLSLTLLRKHQETWSQYPIRIAVSFLIAALAIVPAWKIPPNHTTEIASRFASFWEPPGLDSLTKATLRAKTYPCVWKRVAKYQTILGLVTQAENSLRQVPPDPYCPKP